MRLFHEAPTSSLQRSTLAANRLSEPLHYNRPFILPPLRRGYFSQPPRRNNSDVRSTRLPILVVLLVIVAAAYWYYHAQRASRNGETMAVYYAKLDGSLGRVVVSLRPRQAGRASRNVCTTPYFTRRLKRLPVRRTRLKRFAFRPERGSLALVPTDRRRRSISQRRSDSKPADRSAKTASSKRSSTPSPESAVSIAFKSP